jgi:hypothetical protein
MEQKDSTRRQWLAHAMTAGAGIALTACGGDGGGGGWGGPAPGGDTLDTTARGEVMDALCDKYGELLAAGGTRPPMEALRDWALQQPLIAEAGVGDKTLWTRFTDGRYFVFNDNWGVVPPSAQGRQALQKKDGDRAALAAARTAEVPAHRNALLLKHSGDDFEGEGVNTLSMASKALKDRGWDVNDDHALTVESLKHRGQVGLLYLNSHGAFWGKDDENDYAVLTETRSSEELDEKYRAELDDGTLVYNRAWSLWYLGWDRAKGRPFYAVTGKFFARYMILSPHSLVVLMMCNAGAPKAVLFRGDLQRIGASTIVAWDGNSNLLGFRTVDALFDRLTGAQALPPTGPGGKPNRAFDFDGVWRYLEKENLLVNAPAEGDKPATVRRFSDGSGLTNPVIEQLHVEWKDKLVLHGSFGSEPGTVSVGGTVLPVTLWSPDTLELTLPTGENDPPGSHGDVVVTVRDRTSNVRPVTSWRGEITYLAQELPGDNTRGILHQEVVLQLHVRGDAYANRAEVDGPLKPNTFNLIAASDSKARYVAGGARSTLGSDPFVVSQRGQGELSIVGPQDMVGGVNVMCVICRVDAVSGQMEIVPVQDGGQHYEILHDGEFFNPGVVLFDTPGLGFQNDDGSLHSHRPLMFGTALPLGASGSASPYQRTIVTSTFLDGSPHYQQSVTTSGLTATPALRDDVGR